MLTIDYDDICIFRTTDKAWAVTWGTALKETVVFLPKTMVKVDSVSHTITLPEWLAIEKGLDNHVG